MGSIPQAKRSGNVLLSVPIHLAKKRKHLKTNKVVFFLKFRGMFHDISPMGSYEFDPSGIEKRDDFVADMFSIVGQVFHINDYKKEGFLLRKKKKD